MRLDVLLIALMLCSSGLLMMAAGIVSVRERFSPRCSTVVGKLVVLAHSALLLGALLGIMTQPSRSAPRAGKGQA